MATDNDTDTKRADEFALLGRITGRQLVRPRSDKPLPERGDAMQPAGLAWYLVHSARPESTIDHLLGAAGFDHDDIYFPVLRRMVTPPLRRLSSAQRKRASLFARPVLEPMFRGYFLVRFDICTEEWREIFRIVGVYGIACSGGQPHPLPDSFVERLRALEVDGAIPGETSVDILQYVVGETVRVGEGPFAGFNGTIERLAESDRVWLLLSLFGRQTPVELTLDQIDKL